MFFFISTTIIIIIIVIIYFLFCSVVCFTLLCLLIHFFFFSVDIQFFFAHLVSRKARRDRKVPFPFIEQFKLPVWCLECNFLFWTLLLFFFRVFLENSLLGGYVPATRHSSLRVSVHYSVCVLKPYDIKFNDAKSQPLEYVKLPVWPPIVVNSSQLTRSNSSTIPSRIYIDEFYFLFYFSNISFAHSSENKEKIFIYK